jgi:NAD(P)-dependent dehydrogenase (short-subunit alcohol dehydrogenase family)
MGVLEGKLAIVTGGASGIGEASCLRFAAEGAQVVVADLDAHRAEAVLERIRAEGGDGVALACDVTSSQACADLVGEVEKGYGRLDVLFNNAGTPSPVSLADLTEEEWDRTFAANAKSIFLMTKAAVPLLAAGDGGSVVVTASDAGLVAVPGQPAYCASKGAAVMLTKALALELAPQKIRVNCICPGWVRTPMLMEYYTQRFPDTAERDRIIAETEGAQMIGRFGEPSEIAAAALFLASDDSSYVNGAVFSVDGGFIAHK